MEIKYNKEDKKFLLNLSLKNRDFLINVANMISSRVFSFTAFMISIIALMFSIKGINRTTLILSLIPIIFMITMWIKGWIEIRKNLKNAFNLNKQYQKYYYELFSDKKKEFH